MKIKFINAQQNDLQKIVSTYNSTIASRVVTADLEPVTVNSKQVWFDAHTPDKRPLWLVLIENEYVGWMSFNSFYGRPAYDGTVEVSIYLEESARGKGLGKICLEKAFEVCPELNIKTHYESLDIAKSKKIFYLCFSLPEEIVNADEALDNFLKKNK